MTLCLWFPESDFGRRWLRVGLLALMTKAFCISSACTLSADENDRWLYQYADDFRSKVMCAVLYGTTAPTRFEAFPSVRQGTHSHCPRCIVPSDNGQVSASEVDTTRRACLSLSKAYPAEAFATGSFIAPWNEFARLRWLRRIGKLWVAKIRLLTTEEM